MEVKQSEDGCYRWRIDVDDMWQGGYQTYQAAFDAMIVALANRSKQDVS